MTEKEIGRIEGQLVSLNKSLDDHTKQDMSQFTAMIAQLAGLDAKMDALLIREARKDGEAAGLKKSAALLAAAISGIISIGVAFGPALIR